MRLKNDENYLHFVSLIEIYRSLTDDSFDEQKIEDFTNKIEVYLNKFKFLYPETKISAKMHFMIHYPRCIRYFGNPIDYSCMRFDSKFHQFKRIVRTTNNHINILKSVTTRLQNINLYHLTSEHYFEEFDFVACNKQPNKRLYIYSNELKYFSFL